MMKSLISAITFTALVGCGGGGGSAASSPSTSVIPNSITLTSSAFQNDGAIPSLYQCASKGGGANLPELTWSNLPQNTKAIIIIMDDPDSVGSTFTHYLNILKTAARVSTQNGVSPQLSFTSSPPFELKTPDGSGWILSDLPPCNPQNVSHKYTWAIYALNAEYDSIPSLKILFDPILTSAENTFDSFNLNSIAGNAATAKFTRSSFESSFASFILAKGTLVGRM